MRRWVIVYADGVRRVTFALTVEQARKHARVYRSAEVDSVMAVSG